MRQRRAAAMSSARDAREREQRRGRGRERVRGGSRGWRGAAGDVQERRRQPGREEVAGARGRARRARARPPGREEDDRGGRRRWAGPAGGAGPGKWAPGKSFCSFFKFSVLFYFYLIFCHCFEFKIIQTMPKAPLNIFILLDGLFQKLIKYFRGI